MDCPKHPANEAARLHALRKYQILDTPPEEPFDRLTHLAQSIFQVPIALVSLIDSERQWFKSRQGLNATETPRDISFCGHAILNDDIFYIPDALKDPRFADNPLVTGTPNIRFYAGAPIKTSDGYCLGTLCIIGTATRTLSPLELQMLRELADCVEHEISQQRQQLRNDTLLTLTKITSLPFSDPKTLLHQALTLACSYLNLPFAIVSRIQGDDYTVEIQVSPTNTLDDGQHFNVNDTYCSIMLQNNDVLAIEHMATSPYAKHRSYKKFGMESYIGIAVHVDDKLYGALSFASPQPRKPNNFSTADIEFVRLLARWVSSTLQRWQLNKSLQQHQALNSIIAKTQAQFIQSQNHQNDFELLLRETLKMTDSEYGVIRETLHAKKPQTIAHIGNKKTLFQLEKCCHKTIVSDKPLIIAKTEKNQMFNTFLGLPINYGGQLIAVLGLANRASCYDQNIIDLLQPLLNCISQLIQAAHQQHQLLDSEHRLRAIIDGTRIGTWEWNVQTGETIFNERWANIVGYRLSELEPVNIETWVKLTHPDDFKQSDEKLEAHFEGQSEYYDIQCRMRHKQGHWVWVHDRGKVVSWTDNGKPLLMSGTHADITEQKQGEQQLAAAYELLERSNQAARIGTWEVDLETMQPKWSKTTKHIHEVDENFECPLEVAVNFYKPGESRNTIQSVFNEAIEHGKTFDEELIITTAKGNERWVRTIGVPEFINGHCKRIYGTFQDISERKLAQLEIAAMNRRLTMAADSAGFGVWEWDISKNELVWDEWMFRLYGIDQDRFQGYESWEQSLHPADVEHCQNELQLALSGKKEFNTEFRIIHNTGEMRYIKASALIVRDNEGEPMRMTGVNYDITRNKQDQLSLQEHADYTRAIIDNMVDSIITIDQQGRIESVNQASERIFGYHLEELVGQHFSFLVTDTQRDSINTYFQNSAISDAVANMDPEIEGLRKNGQVFPMDLTLSKVSRSGKKMFVTLIRDISERKRVERMKSEFVSTVSHELRTPLTSISGALGLIAGGTLGKLAKPVQKMVDIAYNNSQRLTYLINDLLDMEKLVAGKMHFNLQQHALKPLLEQALHNNETYDSQQGVSLSLSTNIPDVSVHVDDQRFLQVMSNLLSNAVKFSPENDRVEITTIQTENTVRITVSDHGPGIPVEFQSRIFEKFAQADSSDTRQKSGTGLGLAITRELVEKMRGTINFDSTPGKGTCFFIDLPVYKTYSHTTPENKTTSQTNNKQPILVIEDEPETATVIQSMLNSAGYRVEIAHNGSEALAALETPHYSAVTLDLGLPDIHGLEIIRHLRQQPEHAKLPIVVVSANADTNQFTINHDFSDIEWVAKPFTPEKLIKTLEQLTAHNNTDYHILFIEDDADLHQVVGTIIDQQHHCEPAYSMAEARQQLKQAHFDIIILDIGLPDGSGWELLPEIRQQQPNARIIVLSGTEASSSEKDLVETVLLKSKVSPQQLLEAIERQIH